MKELRLFLTVLTIIICVSSLSAAERMVVRFDNPDYSIAAEFTKGDYDLAAYRPGEYLDIVVTSSELESLFLQGYRPTITQTQQRLENNLQARTRTIEGYRTYEMVLEELESIADDYPEIATLYNIGDSWGKIYTDAGNDNYADFNLDLWALKLTTDPDSLSDKPAVFYMGGQHAREPLSVEVTMAFLNLLLEGYGEDDHITNLIENTEIWFIPLNNPDGHKVVLDRTDVWWRKNIRDNNENGRFDTRNDYGVGDDGVDLNRNFSWEWRFDSRNHRPTYPGPEEGSEPEAFALKNLMNEVHFLAGVNYHTYGELVLWPYGYAHGCRAPDHEALKDLSDRMAETIPRYQRPGYYRSMQSLDLYPARGVLDDWAYGEHGIFCYTIELATEFIPNPEQVNRVVEDNMTAAMILLESVHRSLLTGIITDAVTGEPISAEIYIEEVDETGSFRNPYISRKPFGRYYRMLVPGEYEVIFKSEYHEDSMPYQITIHEDEKTELNVVLYPLMTGTITGNVVDFFDKEPLENVQVSLIESALPPVLTNPEGFFLLEDVPYGNYELKFRADDFGTLYTHAEIVEPQSDFEIVLYPSFFVDTFDTLDNWETNGEWGLSTLFAYEGTYSLADSPEGNYYPSIESYAHLKQRIDLTSAYNASITFRAQYGLQENRDFCYLQVLPESDEHHDWINAAVINGQADWDFLDINIAEYGGEVLNIRFLFTSDEGNTDTGIYIDDFRVYISSPELSTEVTTEIPTPFKLSQNFPNPFNAETTISFTLPRDEHVKLEIFNITGQKVATLVNKQMTSGRHSIAWNGFSEQNNMTGSGIYLYRLSIDGQSVTKKMLLLK